MLEVDMQASLSVAADNTKPICFPEPEYRSPPEHPNMLGARFACETCGATGQAVYGPSSEIRLITRKARRYFFASAACHDARTWFTETKPYGDSG